MKIIFITILILFSKFVFSQSSFEGTMYGDGYFHAYGAELIETSSKEYLLIGGTFSHMGFVGYNFFSKLDHNGDTIWKKKYPPPCGQAGGGYILELKNSNYLLSSYGSDYCQGLGLLYSYFILTDTSGNFLSIHYLGGTISDFRMNNLIADLDGGFVCIGSIEDSNHVAAMINKFDSNGNLVFQKEYLDSSSHDFTLGYNRNDFVKIVQVPDSSYYILGSYGFSPVILHLDVNGDSLSTYQIQDSISLTAVNTIRDFKFKDNILYSIIQTIDNSMTVKYFYHELDITNGSVNKYNSNYNAVSFYPLDNGEKIILTFCDNMNNSGNSSLDDNTNFLKIDSNQNAIWSYCMHPQFLIRNLRFNLSEDKGLLFAASIDSFFSDNYESIYFAKIDNNGTISSNDNLINTADFILYPNPANEELIYKNDDDYKSITIFNSQGEKIFVEENNFSGKINVRYLNEGIYFIRMETLKKIRKLKFVVLH
jgi:hypothetical protein